MPSWEIPQSIVMGKSSNSFRGDFPIPPQFFGNRFGKATAVPRCPDALAGLVCAEPPVRLDPERAVERPERREPLRARRSAGLPALKPLCAVPFSRQRRKAGEFCDFALILVDAD